MNLADDIGNCKTPDDFRVLGDIVGSVHGKPYGQDYEMGCVLWLNGLKVKLSSMENNDEKRLLQALYDQHYNLSEEVLGKDPFYALYVYAQRAPSVRESALV